jgi:hypothetical protein
MKKLYLFLLLIGISFSCENEKDILSIPENAIPIIEETPQNFLMKNLSINLASKLNNKDIRGFIKTEALKQFDGDFDILFTEVVSKEIQISTNNGKARSLSFGEFLFDSDSRGRSKNQTLSEFIDSLNQFIHCCKFVFLNYRTSIQMIGI